MPRQRIDNIVFELTEACNQRCRFCYNYWRDGSPLPAPDKGLCRKTLRKLLSQADVRTLSFSGGEPLCMPGVTDLALMARFRGARVNILTNGTLLTDALLEGFSDIGIGALQIPLLSADASVHDSLTGLPGSWEKARTALGKVAAQMPGKAYAVLVVTKVNAPGIPATLELLSGLGVTGVMVNRFNLGGTGLRHREELVLKQAELERAFADVDAFAAAHPAMRFVSGVCVPMCVLDSRRYPHIRFTYCSTDFNRRPVTVNFRGDVRFCNHSPKVLGNLYQRPIGEILSDPSVAAYFAAVPEHCSHCPHLHPCNGGCRAAAEQVYGRFDREDPVLEILSC